MKKLVTIPSLLTFAVLVTLTAAAAGSSAQATPPAVLYSLDADTDRLVTIDTSTLTITDIGPVGVEFSGTDGLAFTDADNLYVTLFLSGKRDLYRLDPETGAAALVREDYAPVTEGMASRPTDGALFISYNPTSGSSSELGIVNPADGAITPIGTVGIDTDALAFRHTDGGLFGADVTVSGTPSESHFYEINQATGGVIEDLGTFSTTFNLNGMSFGSDGSLYGVMNEFTGVVGTHLARIPLGDAPVDLGLLSSSPLTDLAARPEQVPTPVPAPSQWGLIAMAGLTAAILAWRLRRIRRKTAT